MGFNDQEIVALVGAHALGRCHSSRSFNNIVFVAMAQLFSVHRSGYDGPWTFSPTTFTNDFFQLLFNESYVNLSMVLKISLTRSKDGSGRNGMVLSNSRTRRVEL